MRSTQYADFELLFIGLGTAKNGENCQFLRVNIDWRDDASRWYTRGTHSCFEQQQVPSAIAGPKRALS